MRIAAAGGRWQGSRVGSGERAVHALPDAERGQQIAGKCSAMPIFSGHPHIKSLGTLRHRRLRESIGVGVEAVR